MNTDIRLFGRQVKSVLRTTWRIFQRRPWLIVLPAVFVYWVTGELDRVIREAEDDEHDQSRMDRQP
jgi:hypothetical protein